MKDEKEKDNPKQTDNSLLISFACDYKLPCGYSDWDWIILSIKGIPYFIMTKSINNPIINESSPINQPKKSIILIYARVSEKAHDFSRWMKANQ